MKLKCYPNKEGLYNPQFEHDACGVGFVAHLKSKQSHSIVKQGIQLLINLEHRGATGAEKNSGDGAGILTQMPHKFMQKVAKKQNIILPEFGSYAVGVVFLPQDPNAYTECQSIVEDCIEELGQECLGWRKVPTSNETLGETTLSVEPIIKERYLKGNMIIDKKIEIMRVFKSEISKHPFPRSIQNIKALATFRGATAGVKYAESFMLLKEIN